MNFMETEYCELKSILTKNIKKEIIAFANTNGGKIYIGVTDDGIVNGVLDKEELVQFLANQLIG